MGGIVGATKYEKPNYFITLILQELLTQQLECNTMSYIHFTFNFDTNEIDKPISIVVPYNKGDEEILQNHPIYCNTKSNNGKKYTKITLTHYYTTNHNITTRYFGHWEICDATLETVNKREVFDNFIGNLKNKFYFNLVKFENKLYQPMPTQLSDLKSKDLILLFTVGEVHFCQVNFETDYEILKTIYKEYFATPEIYLKLIPLETTELSLDNILELLYDLSMGREIEHEKGFLLDKYKELTGEKYRWVQ